MHPIGANGVRNTVTKLILMGGEDGTTFHMISGPAQYQIIGQGLELPDVPGREQVSDILDVSTTGFRSDRVVANMGGTGIYGTSDLNLTSYSGASVVNSLDFVYSHLTGLNVDLSLTPRDIVNINAASTVPVDLNLSKGDDNVTIDADYTADNLVQQYTIHGNGGNDTLTFRKSQYTYVYSTLNRPTDTYTIDGNHLTYSTQQSTQPSSNMIDVVRTRSITVDYDGIENVTVDQDVIQSAAFQVAPIAAGMTVTLNGPMPSSILTLNQRHIHRGQCRPHARRLPWGRSL